MPLIAIFIPLQLSLIALGIIFMFRFFLSLFDSLKKRGYKMYRLDKIFHYSVLEETLRLLTNYIFAILLIALFETFIIGTTLIVLLENAVSLTRFVIILISAIELSKAFEHLEGITKLNLFDKIISVLPNKLKEFFESLLKNKNNPDN